ncbi:protein YELLOW LEAF 1, choloroplastic-like [Euphorbia lathyris]|uniref:protein YELLOW LEAF 1, choloroplastic-like n=1 Tax=Euphorbia lathyris TaxID=212925 RepID=UPI003313F5F2
MLAFTTSTVGGLPLLKPAKTRSGFRDRTNQASCSPVSASTQFEPSNTQSRCYKLAMSGPIRLPQQLQHINGRKNCDRKRSASVTCSAATNARCSASGQSQTVTLEAPTITKAPVREPTQTPKIDDGGPGLPPGGDDGGGGGGGGGGGNWSGGFFFFGFLAFLGFLKDKETDEDYRDSRRR